MLKLLEAHQDGFIKAAYAKYNSLVKIDILSEIRTSQPVVPGASYVIMKETSFSGSRTQRHIQYVNYILVSEL